jgi:hypothetical protein
MSPMTVSVRRSLRTVKDIFEILALIGAGSWSIWLFFYQDRILPKRAPLHISVDSELEVVGRSAELTAVKAVVTLMNDSSGSARFLGTCFTLTAYEVTANAASVAPQERMALVRSRLGEFIDLPRMVLKSKGDIINSGRLVPSENWYLDRGEKQRVEFITFVPRRYSLASLHCDVHVTKDENWLASKNWKLGRDGGVTFDFSPRPSPHGSALFTYSEASAVLWEPMNGSVMAPTHPARSQFEALSASLARGYGKSP